MRSNRRVCLQRIAGGVAASLVASAARGEPAPRYKAVAFDAFPILDPRPVSKLAEELFPGKGAELGAAWRTRQFEYQWLRALAGRYVDFERATEEALEFATRSLKLELTPGARERLMGAFLQLKAWPDVPPVLKALKDAGVRLAFLSNATPRILEAGLTNSGLRDRFEHVLSTDRVRTYKPDPRAYQMALDAFGLRREEVVFAAYAGWDAAGAKWFGYPTIWINRASAPAEGLGVEPDAVGRDLGDLARFVGVAVGTG